MNVALAGRGCGGEGHLGGRRREYVQMWAYARTSVQKKRCLRTRVRRLNENMRGRERKAIEILLCVNDTQEVTEQVNISLALVCSTFAHKDTDMGTLSH